MRTDRPHSRAVSATGPLAPGIYAVLDLEITARRALDPAAVARAFCSAGVVAVQLRGKSETASRMLAVALDVAAACRRSGVPFVVNDRPDVAALVQADGVHVGQDDLPVAAARAVLPPGALIGLSTHGAAQLRAAQHEPADYVGLGPVFPTTTKADADPALGLDRFRRLARRSVLPVVAIGGIRIGDVAAVRDAGAHAVALVSALLAAGDPGMLAAAAVREFGPAARGSRRVAKPTR